MQTFYVIIKKGHLLIYEKNKNAYETVYLGGNAEYSYSINRVYSNIDSFLNTIVEEYNLDAIEDINLIVIDNENSFISNEIISALGERVKRRINIEKLVFDVLQVFEKDKKIHITEYGINYDGKKYSLHESNLVKEEFNLLSYSLKDDELMKLLDELSNDLLSS